MTFHLSRNGNSLKLWLKGDKSVITNNGWPWLYTDAFCSSWYSCHIPWFLLTSFEESLLYQLCNSKDMQMETMPLLWLFRHSKLKHHERSNGKDGSKSMGFHHFVNKGWCAFVDWGNKIQVLFSENNGRLFGCKILKHVKEQRFSTK